MLPGDPARLDRIAAHLDQVEELAYNREFRSLRGFYKGVRVMALSTGLGGPSTAVAVEELAKLGVSHMIRIGSCGALQRGIHVGDLVLVNGTVRNDGTSRTYIEDGYPAVADFSLLVACKDAVESIRVPYHIGIAKRTTASIRMKRMRYMHTGRRKALLHPIWRQQPCMLQADCVV